MKTGCPKRLGGALILLSIAGVSSSSAHAAIATLSLRAATDVIGVGETLTIEVWGRVDETTLGIKQAIFNVWADQDGIIIVNPELVSASQPGWISLVVDYNDPNNSGTVVGASVTDFLDPSDNVGVGEFDLLATFTIEGIAAGTTAYSLVDGLTGGDPPQQIDLEVILQDNTSLTTGAGLVVDSPLTLIQVTPEPASLAMLGAVGVFLAAHRRRG